MKKRSAQRFKLVGVPKKKQYFPHIFGLVGLQKINKRAKKPFRIRLCYCYCVELGLGPCHFWAGRGTIIWHDLKYGMARNILGHAGTTRTRELCRA